MRRHRLPRFIAEVIDEPGPRAALIAGAVALFAAGMNPRVFSASVPSVQAAIRMRPELEAMAVLGALVAAGLLFIGGAVGDTARARRIIVGGLVVELAAALVSVFLPVGPLLALSRLVGTAAAAFVIPVSLASVATSYQGVPRATAIGIAYSAFGLANAAVLFLLALQPGWHLPAYVAAAGACVLAIVVSRDRLPLLEQPKLAERPYVLTTALWGMGIVTLTTGVVWFGTGLWDLLRWTLILAGGLTLAGVIVYGRRRRRRRRAAGLDVEQRPVAAAVFVGLILAIAQTIPLSQLPIYFRYVHQYGTLASTLALVPLFVALVLAGPIAGIQLRRYSPRAVVGIGVVGVGLGDLVLAAITVPNAPYVIFILPFVLVAVGFVFATTVRTAIIFASVPRGLPATAAALNHASLELGSRIGIVLATAVAAGVALSAYEASLAGLPPAEIDAAVAAFGDVLAAVGLPSFGESVAGIDPDLVAPYVDAYSRGVRVAMALGALIALVGGLVVWFLLPNRDPLAVEYQFRDERPVPRAPSEESPTSTVDRPGLEASGAGRVASGARESPGDGA